MTRRRLVKAACVAVVALGAAWWFYGDSLTAEEWRLIGTWRHGDNLEFVFCIDRRCWIVQHKQNRSRESRWSARDGIISLNNEMSPFRRAYRFVAQGVGIVSPSESMRGEMKTENEIVIISGIVRFEWTRDLGDRRPARRSCEVSHDDYG
jgi:hypothetical protein